MRTRTVAILGIALVIGATAVFAGGQSEATGSEGTVQLTLWSFPFASEEEDRVMFGKMIDELHSRHPNINVNVEFFPWGGRRERMLTAVAAGVPPDVAYLNDDMKPLYEGNLLNLYDHVSKDDLKDFKHAAIEGSMYKGELAYLPVVINSVAMFYNLDVTDKAGISEAWIDQKHNWKEFLEVCDKIKATGAWVYTDGAAEASLVDKFSNWIYQAGGDYYNENLDKSTVDTPEAVEAVRMWARMWHDYTNPADMDKKTTEALEGVFALGKAGIIMEQNQAVVKMRETNPAIRVKLAYAMKNRRRISNGTIAGYGVFNATKHPEEAVELVKAITAPDGMYAIDKRLNFIAPRVSVDEKLMAELQDPVYQRAAENTQWFMPTVPASPVGAGANEELKSQLQRVLLGRATPEQATADLAAKVNKMLDDYYRKR